jgi:Ca2+-binding EF-hand superfamily protein
MGGGSSIPTNELAQLSSDSVYGPRIRDVFGMLDADRDGFVDLGEMQRYLYRLVEVEADETSAQKMPKQQRQQQQQQEALHDRAEMPSLDHNEASGATTASGDTDTWTTATSAAATLPDADTVPASKLTEQRATLQFSELDLDRNGQISLEEFCAAIDGAVAAQRKKRLKKGETSNHRNLRAEIDQAFAVLDSAHREASLAGARSQAKLYVDLVSRHTAAHLEDTRRARERAEADALPPPPCVRRWASGHHGSLRRGQRQRDYETAANWLQTALPLAGQSPAVATVVRGLLGNADFSLNLNRTAPLMLLLETLANVADGVAGTLDGFRPVDVASVEDAMPLVLGGGGTSAPPQQGDDAGSAPARAVTGEDGAVFSDDKSGSRSPDRSGGGGNAQSPDTRSADDTDGASRRLLQPLREQEMARLARLRVRMLPPHALESHYIGVAVGDDDDDDDHDHDNHDNHESSNNGGEEDDRGDSRSQPTVDAKSSGETKQADRAGSANSSGAGDETHPGPADCGGDALGRESKLQDGEPGKLGPHRREEEEKKKAKEEDGAQPVVGDAAVDNSHDLVLGNLLRLHLEDGEADSADEADDDDDDDAQHKKDKKPTSTTSRSGFAAGGLLALLVDDERCVGAAAERKEGKEEEQDEEQEGGRRTTTRSKRRRRSIRMEILCVYE